jgi:hypothetical protein
MLQLFGGVGGGHQLHEVFFLLEGVHLCGVSNFQILRDVQLLTKLSWPPGSGVRVIPIFVTIPKLDCEKRPLVHMHQSLSESGAIGLLHPSYSLRNRSEAVRETLPGVIPW